MFLHFKTGLRCSSYVLNHVAAVVSHVFTLCHMIKVQLPCLYTPPGYCTDNLREILRYLWDPVRRRLRQETSLNIPIFYYTFPN
jgi:hypothetical protein